MGVCWDFSGWGGGGGRGCCKGRDPFKIQKHKSEPIALKRHPSAYFLNPGDQMLFGMAMLVSYVHSLMSYKGFMCNNKSLIQIEDLGRSNNILNICTTIIE